MARHRNVVVPLQPKRLLTFRPDDWIGPGLDIGTAWQRWSDARFSWLLDHRDQTLGGSDIIDVIFEGEG